MVSPASVNIVRLQERIEDAYWAWLNGSTLRQLGEQYGLSHATIKKQFELRWGKGATDDLEAKSLIRSMIQDYPDNPTVRKWAREHMGLVSGKTYSKKTIATLSKFQTVHDPALLEFMVEGTREEPSGDIYGSTYIKMMLLYLSAVCLAPCPNLSN
jgi:hypothetical protein